VSQSISVPTVKGVGSAFKDFGMGALAGLILVLAMRIFGAFGFLAAPLLAGAMFKNDTGKTVTTIAGLALGMALLGGGLGVSSSSASSDPGTM